MMEGKRVLPRKSLFHFFGSLCDSLLSFQPHFNNQTNVNRTHYCEKIHNMIHRTFDKGKMTIEATGSGEFGDPTEQSLVLVPSKFNHKINLSESS